MSDAATASLTLYGIPNCDQVRKARNWLAGHGIEPVFHDFKKAGLSRALVSDWLKTLDWTVLVNRKGTTWRVLSEERRALIFDTEQATLLMLEAPSIVKRPVLQHGQRILVGFDSDLYQSFFHTQTAERGPRT